jgi:hypothetical protein
MRRRTTPAGEWLAVVLPVFFPVVLIASVAEDASKRHAGWSTMGLCLLGGITVPLVYTLVFAREGRLFLRSTGEIERNRRHIELLKPAGWAIGAGFLLLAALFGGVTRVAAVSALAGLMLGFWPGLLANFIRLRREGHWS